jgi:hypothetical protein
MAAAYAMLALGSSFLAWSLGAPPISLPFVASVTCIGASFLLSDD